MHIRSMHRIPKLSWIRPDRAGSHDLVVNAKDAMPNGGKLLVSTMEIRRSAASPFIDRQDFPGDYIVLQVTDTGIGFPNRFS
jgi:hypothetical protein